MRPNALDIFIEKRVDLVIEDVKKKLPNLSFDVIDTKQAANEITS
jgi:3-methyladenine DNA glycosylase AlkC